MYRRHDLQVHVHQCAHIVMHVHVVSCTCSFNTRTIMQSLQCLKLDMTPLKQEITMLELQ